MKNKIKNICFKAQKGMNRNIVVNGIEHEFMSYMSVDLVIQKLAREYELTNRDIKEIKEMW